MIRALVASMRPTQWVKNGFVLVAPIFSRRVFERDVAVHTAAAVGLFCLTASGVYLMNDLADRERDRLHPEKRHRPIASGELPVPAALVGALVLMGGGIGLGFLISFRFGGLVALYVGIQVAYSGLLRRVVLLDVFCIASGFVIRVLGGGYAVGVPLSSWLILTTIFLSLFLALCKRRAEWVHLENLSGGHRETLQDYDPEFLDQLISVTTASVVICYSLYTLSERTVREFGTTHLVFTVPFVIFGIFRYLFLVHRRRGGGSPTTAVLRDPFLLANSALWAVMTAAILYR